MTGRKQLEANEKREAIFARDNYTCQHCGGSIYQHGTPQLAHRVSKTRHNLETYGPEVIHHPLNLVSVCSIGACNDAFNLNNNRMARMELLNTIVSLVAKGE